MKESPRSLCAKFLCAVSIASVLAASSVPLARAQATAPADPQAEIQQLRSEVAQLAAQNESLRVMNEALKKKLAVESKLGPAALPPKPFNGDTFTKRAEEYVSRQRLDPSDKAHTLADAAKIDRQIAEYAHKSDITGDALAALYRGYLSIGMPEEELKIIAPMIDVKFETTSTKTCDVVLWQPQPDPPMIQVVISGGKITAIDHTPRSSGTVERITPGQTPNLSTPKQKVPPSHQGGLFVALKSNPLHPTATRRRISIARISSWSPASTIIVHRSDRRTKLHPSGRQ